MASRLQPPAPEPLDSGYDETIAGSFPASDPPPGVIKLGPRPQQKAVEPPRPATPVRERKPA
jgi:hypothetical protein